MPSERGGMGDQSSAIAGECKGSRINKPQPNGREDSEEEKDPLESRLWVWGSRTSIHDITDDVIGGNRGGVLGFYQLAVRTNDFFRLLSIFGGRKVTTHIKKQVEEKAAVSGEEEEDDEN